MNSFISCSLSLSVVSTPLSLAARALFFSNTFLSSCFAVPGPKITNSSPFSTRLISSFEKAFIWWCRRSLWEF